MNDLLEIVRFVGRAAWDVLPFFLLSMFLSVMVNMLDLKDAIRRAGICQAGGAFGPAGYGSRCFQPVLLLHRNSGHCRASNQRRAVRAGPVTTVPAMAAVWSIVRKHVFARDIAISLFGAMLLGFVVNAIF